MKKIDLNKYSEFVEGITSKTSNDLTTFMDRLDRVDGNYEAYGLNGEMEHGPDVNVPLLLTASIGLGGEVGEFQEITKKVFFHGKNLNTETYDHYVKELGDIIWYWTNACRALNIDPNDVISRNVDKLSDRYPGAKFDPYYSENRKEGDV